VLADFRAWLTDLAAPPPTPTEEPPAVDLHTLVAQFTALRHEVNLQTKATRTSLEQNADTLKQLEGAIDELRDRPAAKDDETGPLIKALVDVYDNLALALRQVEKHRDSIAAPLARVTSAVEFPLPPVVVGQEQTRVYDLGPHGTNLEPQRPDGGWLSRFFGRRPQSGIDWDLINRAVEQEDHIWRNTVGRELEAKRDQVQEASKALDSSLDGLLAGYRMSLARVDRAIEQAGLEVIATTGEPFDPELMEVVEVVGDTGRPAGEVIEEVRRGYLRGDVVYRYAQVKVAR